MPEDTTETPTQQPVQHAYPYMQYGLMPDLGVSVQLLFAENAAFTFNIPSEGMDAIEQKRREIKQQMEDAARLAANGAEGANEPTPLRKRKKG